MLPRWICSYRFGALAGSFPVDATTRRAAENFAARRLEALLGIRKVDLDFIKAEAVANFSSTQRIDAQAARGSDYPSV